jgi:hypothetical protein
VHVLRQDKGSSGVVANLGEDQRERQYAATVQDLGPLCETLAAKVEAVRQNVP